MVHLIYGAWRFQYDEGVGITNTGNTFTRTYSDGVWSEESQNTEALALNPGVNGQVYQRIYTNANIFNGDDIWLAENTVTPLDEEQQQINMKSQLAGFLGAWVSRVRQFPHREPVAFLYGTCDTPLPDIYSVYTPELQKQFPYAYMFISAWGSPTFGIATARPYSSDGKKMAIPPHDRIAVMCSNALDKWAELTDVHNFPNGITDHLFPFWTNFDLKSEDGTLYLAASEPIPIYE